MRSAQRGGPRWRDSRLLPPPPAAGSLRVLLANVYTANPHRGSFVELVRDLDPDIVAVLEVDEGWLRALDPLRRDYPYQRAVPRSDNFGIAFLSRIPVERFEIRELAHESFPMILGTVELLRVPVTVAAAHPIPPVGNSLRGLRNRQLAALGDLRTAHPGEFVLAADLNTTPWSAPYRELERGAGDLRNAALGFGLLPTWPAQLPLARVPVDHVLLSGGLAVREYEVHPVLGSDHHAVLVTIGLRRSAWERAEGLGVRATQQHGWGEAV